MDAKVDVFRNVAVPMRDEVILRADIYLPVDRAIPLPALVTRTPYDKSGGLTSRSDYGRLVRLGFAVVVQDKRGRHHSDGEFTLLRDDGIGVHQDGYDTVEWISAQGWCNGAVGAFGLSYLGFTTMAAAIAAPPSLRAGVSMQPSSDEFTDRTFVDGVLNLLDNVNWATSELLASSLIDRMPVAERIEVQADLDRHRARGDDRYAQLPLMEWPFLRHLPTIWTGQLKHRDDAEYFAENRVAQHEAERIRVPIEHVGGWFDPFSRNTVRHYELTAQFSGARDRQRLVMGPWLHGGLAQSSNGGVEFPDSATDSNALIAQWMETWVTPQGAAGDPLSGPAALLYVLGANRWRAEPDWPIPGTTSTPVFFGADGTLDFNPTPAGERTYSYDPHHPHHAPGITEGMRDHTEFHDRDNLLTYTSATLTEELEITGWPRVVLYAATSSTDLDWLVEMHVVDTDGVSRLFNEGIVRARYRHGRDHPEPVEPDAITQYSVALRPISIVLRPGERLKVVVTGGKFPVFERNPQAFVDLNWATDSDIVTARNTIYSGELHASHIELPVVPAERRGEWVANPWPLISLPVPTPVGERPAEELP
jgi:putative CocE/NonD family hydrolase